MLTSFFIVAGTRIQNRPIYFTYQKGRAGHGSSMVRASWTNSHRFQNPDLDIIRQGQPIHLQGETTAKTEPLHLKHLGKVSTNSHAQCLWNILQIFKQGVLQPYIHSEINPNSFWSYLLAWQCFIHISVVINNIFRPYLMKFVTALFDNILIYSKNLKEHVYHLKEVLHCLLVN